MIDPMLERVRGAAEQLRPSGRKPAPMRGRIPCIVVLGTGGGSAMAGEVLKRRLDKLGLPPVDVCGEYRPPGYAFPGTPVFAVSHSGNTQETLAAVKAMDRGGAGIWAFTSGGELAALAKRRGWPLWRLSEGAMPRALFYEILAAMLRTVAAGGRLPGVETELREAAALIRDGLAARERAALALARKLKGLIPYALGAEPVGAVAAIRLKNQLAENAKRIAFAGKVPRAHHDEIVGWSAPKSLTKRFGLVLLRDSAETFEHRRRLDATKELLAPRAGAIGELVSEGRSLLARMLTLCHACDLLSVHAALLDGEAPTPVDLIDELKRRMA